MLRLTIHYSGRVQGVGFRYTARGTASAYAVTGYVQNLPDGRVKLVAEGDSDELEAFSKDLARRMKHHITNTQTDRTEATGEFEDFGVRY